MSRSLKKAPFVEKKLYDRICAMNAKRREEGHKDLVPCFGHIPRIRWSHNRRS